MLYTSTYIYIMNTANAIILHYKILNESINAAIIVTLYFLQTDVNIWVKPL